MNYLWALVTLITTLVLSVWAACRAWYVCMVEGFSLTAEIWRDKDAADS